MSARGKSPTESIKDGQGTMTSKEGDDAVRYTITVQLPLKRQYMVVFIAFRILQVIFSIIVLGTVASLYSASKGTCDLFRTVNYPSYGSNPVYISTSSTEDGKASACELGIATSVLGLIVGVNALLDAFLLLVGRVPPIDRPTIVYVVEWTAYVVMTALWCASAIFVALGYVSTCNGTVCENTTNQGTWTTQTVALVAVIFTWLSIMPWASDLGLITREYFRRVNYHRQLAENEERERELRAKGEGANEEEAAA